MKFAVDEAAANQDGLNLVIRLVSDRHRHLFGDDRDIGEVVVPIKELLACKTKLFVRNVTLPDGNLKGTLKFRSTIGEKFPVDVAAETTAGYTYLPQVGYQQPTPQPAGGWFGRVLFGAIVIASNVLGAVDM
ncbi:hypothetical protein SLE2022_081900 [Rubroshorea leprosula]